MKTIQKKNGFTLAELLIVVAIIAVLVAISIPIFTTKLEASRESTDAANLRSAYAAGTTALLTGKYDVEVTSGTGPSATSSASIDFPATGTVKCYYTKSGQIVPSSYLTSDETKLMKGKSQINGYQGTDLDELPAGVFLFSSSTQLDSNTNYPDDDEETLGNSKGGYICIILNNHPSTLDDYNVVVYFEPKATGG